MPPCALALLDFELTKGDEVYATKSGICLHPVLRSLLCSCSASLQKDDYTLPLEGCFRNCLFLQKQLLISPTFNTLPLEG